MTGDGDPSDCVPPIADIDADAEQVFSSRWDTDDIERAARGRRARSLVSLRTGKYVRHRLAQPTSRDLALDATLRAAAIRVGRSELAHAGLEVMPEDLRRKVRKHRSPCAVAFVVDNSYSLQAEDLVDKVKGVAFSLLQDAVTTGDKVALVTFRGGAADAAVALPFTRSVTLAAKRLEEVPLSGRTPLAHALRTARRLLRQETFKHDGAIPVLVAITDGLPTVPLRQGGDPVASVLAEGRALRRERVHCIVADAAMDRALAASCGRELARQCNGYHVPLRSLTPEALADLLKDASD